MLNLVVVAHPDDEVLAFGGFIKSAPCDVVCVTDGNAADRGIERAEEFARACAALGAHSAKMLFIPDIYEARLSVHEITRRLRQEVKGLEVYDNIATHGYWENHWHHQDVCYAVALCRPDGVLVRAHQGMPADLLVQMNLEDKVAILNTIYMQEMDAFTPKDILATELYTRMTFQEVAANLAWQYDGNIPLMSSFTSDPWSFETSYYERKRMVMTAQVISRFVLHKEFPRILELGAAIGTMTKAICEAIPKAVVMAVENNHEFATHLKTIHEWVWEKPVKDAVLSSYNFDLTVACEVFDYMTDWPDVIRQINSQYFVLSGPRTSDMFKVCKANRFHLCDIVELDPTFEVLNKEVKVRVGTTISVWKKVLR